MREPLTVGMLVPPEVSASAAFRSVILDMADDELAADITSGGEILFDDGIGKIVDELRELIREVADESRTRIDLTEYQVFGDDDGSQMMGKKRRVAFLENDLLVTLDPSPTQCGMIQNAIRPRQRIVAGFTSSDHLDTQGRMLSAASKLPLIHREGIRFALQRAFFLKLPKNEDERSLGYQSAKQTVARAFSYPYSPTVPLENDRYSRLWNPDDNGS